jgi:cell division septal protein FtsQ
VRLPVRKGLDLDRILPSARFLLLGAAAVVTAVAVYAAARTTLLFEVRSVEIVGAPAPVVKKAQAALAPLRGSSLVALDSAAVERRIEELPLVLDAQVDRAFPHTLRVVVVPEQPLALVRRGADAWVVSVRGRIVAPAPRAGRPALPRIWVSRSTEITVGAHVPAEGEHALRAVVPLAGTRLLHRVRDVRAGQDELTLVLRSGLELRLGDARRLPLKIAVAEQVVARLARSEQGARAYVDLGVPERPVAGGESQLAG